MANNNIEIPIYVANGGAGLTGAAAEMNFEFLKTLCGIDKSASAPSISPFSTLVSNIMALFS